MTGGRVPKKRFGGGSNSCGRTKSGTTRYCSMKTRCARKRPENGVTREAKVIIIMVNIYTGMSNLATLV